MAYATQDQIRLAAGGSSTGGASDRFVELADWNGDDIVDPDVIAEAQLRADGWIDGYLRQRYATPIATPSDTLIRLAADECVYWLRSKRQVLTQADLDERKDRERQLELMRDGKLRPDDPLPPKSTAVSSAVVELGGCFSRDDLKGIW